MCILCVRMKGFMNTSRSCHTSHCIFITQGRRRRRCVRCKCGKTGIIYKTRPLSFYTDVWKCSTAYAPGCIRLHRLHPYTIRHLVYMWPDNQYIFSCIKVVRQIVILGWFLLSGAVLCVFICVFICVFPSLYFLLCKVLWEIALKALYKVKFSIIISIRRIIVPQCAA